MLSSYSQHQSLSERIVYLSEYSKLTNVDKFEQVCQNTDNKYKLYSYLNRYCGNYDIEPEFANEFKDVTTSFELKKGLDKIIPGESAIPSDKLLSTMITRKVVDSIGDGSIMRTYLSIRHIPPMPNISNMILVRNVIDMIPDEWRNNWMALSEYADIAYKVVEKLDKVTNENAHKYKYLIELACANPYHQLVYFLIFTKPWMITSAIYSNPSSDAIEYAFENMDSIPSLRRGLLPFDIISPLSAIYLSHPNFNKVFQFKNVEFLRDIIRGDILVEYFKNNLNHIRNNIRGDNDDEIKEFISQNPDNDVVNFLLHDIDGNKWLSKRHIMRNSNPMCIEIISENIREMAAVKLHIERMSENDPENGFLISPGDLLIEQYGDKFLNLFANENKTFLELAVNILKLDTTNPKIQSILATNKCSYAMNLLESCVTKNKSYKYINQAISRNNSSPAFKKLIKKMSSDPRARINFDHLFLQSDIPYRQLKIPYGIAFIDNYFNLLSAHLRNYSVHRS